MEVSLVLNLRDTSKIINQKFYEYCSCRNRICRFKYRNSISSVQSRIYRFILKKVDEIKRVKSIKFKKEKEISDCFLIGKLYICKKISVNMKNKQKNVGRQALLYKLIFVNMAHWMVLTMEQSYLQNHYEVIKIENGYQFTTIIGIDYFLTFFLIQPFMISCWPTFIFSRFNGQLIRMFPMSVKRHKG